MQENYIEIPNVFIIVAKNKIYDEDRCYQSWLTVIKAINLEDIIKDDEVQLRTILYMSLDEAFAVLKKFDAEQQTLFCILEFKFTNFEDFIDYINDSLKLKYINFEFRPIRLFDVENLEWVGKTTKQERKS